MTTTKTFKEMTADERVAMFDRLRTEASERNHRRWQEDLDPSDCAVSYFADNHSSGLAWARRELCRNDCYAPIPVLFRLMQDGTREVAQYAEVNGVYGESCGVLDSDGNFTGEFVKPIWYTNETERKKKNLAAKGFEGELRLRKAWCKLKGSSLLNLYVHYFPTEEDVEGMAVPEWYGVSDRDFRSDDVQESFDYYAYYNR